MYEFKLPDLGEGIHEGEILKWHVQPGQTIREDDPLIEIETDKAAVTIPSPVGGRVAVVNGAVGDTVQVGSVLVAIETGAAEAGARPAAAVEKPAEKPVEKPAAKPAPPAPPPAPAAPPPAPAAPPPAAPPAGRRGPVPAAPATRRLARELGVDLERVPASGPAGRVTPEDVERFARAGQAGAAPAAPPAAAEPAPAAEEPPPVEGTRPAAAIPFLDLDPLPDFSQWGEVEAVPLRSIRRKVARRMVTSMILIPHVAHMDEADVTALEEFRLRERQRFEGQPGGRMTLLAFVMRAVAAGLESAPAFNASLDPFKEEIIYKRYTNIGFAVDTGKGLIVPVVKSVGCKSLIQVSADIEELAAKARDGKLDVADMRGGTFTITNIGPLGGTAMLPIINYPETAILGMGRVQDKPVVRDGAIVIRKILPLTLAFDHRVADGADAARFVTELARQLGDPSLLLLGT